MPSSKPRIGVTVSEEQHALLADLGKMQGRSISSYLLEMLDAATPLLRSLVPAMREASQELEAKDEELRGHIGSILGQLKAMGLADQLDLDTVSDGRRQARPQRAAASEDGPSGGRSKDAAHG